MLRHVARRGRSAGSSLLLGAQHLRADSAPVPCPFQSLSHPLVSSGHLHSSAPASGTPEAGPRLASPLSPSAASSAEGGGQTFRAPPVDLESVSALVRQCEYAVRGDIVTRAGVLEAQLKAHPGSLPFPSVLYCNIGNPHALGQQPVTFFREVLALCDHPGLLQAAQAQLDPHSPAGARGPSLPFSTTAVTRAERIVRSLPAHATGAYSHSQGIPLCRFDVAAGIGARDGGHVADPDSIFLTDGASPAVQMLLRLLVRGPADGVHCPIPQYPLYSATLSLLGGTLVPYFLDEAEGAGGCWSLSTLELERQLARAVEAGVTPRVLVVINPGNPTGQVLEEEEQRAIVEFCSRHNLLLLADEVYQENVYAQGKVFRSFKKVARDMGVGPADLALVSVHSASKGFYGECGRRGGYMEVTGVPADVVEQLYKLASVTLCSNVAGQVLCSLIMRPPREGDDAYNLFEEERGAVLSSLGRKAKLIVDRLNAEEGVTCCATEGAMYAFPRLHLPPRALEVAAAQGISADALYARRLLEATGIVVVPGSGFGQRPGTAHLRFTILPPEAELPSMMDRFSAFHYSFMKEFR